VTTPGPPDAPDRAVAGVPLRQAQVTLVGGELAEVRRLPLLAGSWFDGAADVPVRAVLNTSAARQWGGVGTELLVSISARQPLLPTVVSGIIADGLGDPLIYLPLPAVLHAQPYAFDTWSVELLLHHRSASTESLSNVAERMAVAGGGSLSAPARRVDTVGLLLEQLRTQQRAFLLVAVVALTIAALGMINIGLASVSERARELVIRRAVGATRADILGQMVVAAVVIGVVAAAVAVAVGWVGVQWWVPQRISPASAIEPPGLPWVAAGWGLVASLATTVAGAILPAIVAARLDVATALRD
jgi:hypothetical protein